MKSSAKLEARKSAKQSLKFVAASTDIDSSTNS